MKVLLEYNLPEETEQYSLAMDGAKNKYKLSEIWEQLFRPRHKHGYSDERLSKLADSKHGRELMDLLEQLYHDIVQEGG